MPPRALLHERDLGQIRREMAADRNVVQLIRIHQAGLGIAYGQPAEILVIPFLRGGICLLALGVVHVYARAGFQIFEVLA